MRKFRYSGAIVIVIGLTALGALPLALSSWYLAPILLVPAIGALWYARAGVDVSPAGMTVRSALAGRRFGWDEVAGFVASGNRVAARLTSGAVIALPGVRPVDVPRLMAAGGQEFAADDDSDSEEAEAEAEAGR